MTPEIYILLGGKAETVGTDLNRLRARLIKAVLGDLVSLHHRMQRRSAISGMRHRVRSRTLDGGRYGGELHLHLRAQPGESLSQLRGEHPREALLWNSAGPDYRTGSGVMTVDLDL